MLKKAQALKRISDLLDVIERTILHETDLTPEERKSASGAFGQMVDGMACQDMMAVLQEDPDEGR